MSVAWVPVVDISRHQGAVDFAKMRARGVRGLILRISHGLVLDDRAEIYYRDAIAAGFPADQIGWYPFLNPKRGTGAQTATFAVDHIRRISARSDFFYMLDVENYRNESPNVGLAPVFGAAYAAYIREHIATVLSSSPKSRVIGYTNRAYWNGNVVGVEWVGDDQLAAELDWIVARYPAYSPAAYERRPLPASPDGWADWAFNVAPDGPFPPRGGTWSAWQFSAGYNRQGAAYGASSSDLDLNIVHPDAWARWTATAVPPTPIPQPPHMEDEMNFYVVAGANARFIGTPVQVRWTGPGDAKIEAAIATQLVAGNLTPVDLTGGPGAFAATFLDGPLPTGDTLHEWSAESFANTAEILAREADVEPVDPAGRRVKGTMTIGAMSGDFDGTII